MDSTFLVFWGALITALQQPIHIRNWTRDSGFTGDDFNIQLHDRSIVCDEPHITMTRDDFWTVWQNWNQYMDGNLPRQAIRDAVPYKSKYIISILHHFMEA